MHKKIIGIFIAFMFSLSFFSSLQVHAADPKMASSRIEGMLVVDVSRSMLSSDPNNISKEAMKMFVDMSSLKGDKIGVIAYANDVVSKKELVRIQSDSDKQALKEFIDGLNKYPNTDISTGVTEAVKMLDAGHEKDYFPLIVLLADGNNELDKNKPKTAQQADEQLDQAMTDAKSKGYPIYVIGLNADGKLNKTVLQNIATGTSGKYFETSNAGDLPGILSEIFADHLKLKMVPVQDVVGQDEYQDVKITVPNENVLEANITLISSKPLNLKLTDPSGKEQAIPSETISFTKSKNYSMLKLINPVPGDWTLKVKGFPQDKINIKLVFNNDLQLKLAPLGGKIKAGDTVKISAFLEDNGNKLNNKEFYQALKATLFVKEIATGTIDEIQLMGMANGFSGQFKFEDSGNYEVTVKAEGNSFYRETAAQTITIFTGAAESEPASAQENPSPGKSLKLPPWVFAVIGLIAFALLTTPSLSTAAKKRRARRGFTGQLIVEIKNEETGVSSEPKIKKLNAFKGEFHLTELFQLDPAFAETDEITFVPITDNTLLLLNKSRCTIDKEGEMIDAESGHRLRRNDKLRITLVGVKKSISIKNVS